MSKKTWKQQVSVLTPCFLFRHNSHQTGGNGKSLKAKLPNSTNEPSFRQSFISYYWKLFAITIAHWLLAVTVQSVTAVNFMLITALCFYSLILLTDSPYCKNFFIYSTDIYRPYLWLATKTKIQIQFQFEFELWVGHWREL